MWYRDVLVDRLPRGSPDELVKAMITGLVGLYADHGRMLRAIDAAAASDPEVAAELDRALAGPRRLLEGLVAEAAHPPADPREFSLLLMATHRAYLLDKFGDGNDSPENRRDTVATLAALWQRLLTG